MTNIKSKTEELMEIRRHLAEIDETYEKAAGPLKTRKEALQTEIMTELKTQEQFSIRFDFATLTLAVRRTPKVVDEDQVIAVLKKMRLAKEYVKPRLTDTFMASLPALIKEHPGFPGVDIKETEFLSVRTADEEKDKRKIVTE